MAVDPARPRAPSRAPEVRTPPRGDNWATRLPALVREVVGAGSSPSTGAHRECPHDTRSPPALAPGPCCPVEAAGGDPRRAGAARTTPHLCPIRTPAPTGALDGERHRGVIADRDRVGGGGSLPAQCGRARGRRCVRDRRPACSAAGAAGPVAGGPAAQKGGWRVSFTPRPAPLPARSGAMTPFPMSAGAAAHPKVTRRPPFSPRRRPGPRRWGPPEVFTHPGRHRHRPVHDGGRCRSDVPREAARRTEGLIPVRAGPVVRDVAPEVGGGGAPREPRRGAAWSASTSLNPRARTPGRRARGLPDDLAG